MNKFILAIAILMTTSSLSYARCMLNAGSTPKLPDAHTATAPQMLEAKAAAIHYMTESKKFVECAQGRGDRRTDKVLNKMMRFAKSYKKSHGIFMARVNAEPSILQRSEQLVAQR